MTTGTKENLSQYVQRILRQKKLKLADVERTCGKEITGSYISRIIKGTVTNLTVEKIDALARGLDVDPYELFQAALGRAPQTADEPSSVDSAVFVDTIQKLLVHPDLVDIVQTLEKIKNHERQALVGAMKYAEAPKQKFRKKKTS